MTTLALHTAPATSARQAFEDLLPRYVNTGCLSRRDVLAGLTAPSGPFQRNAPAVAQAHAALRAEAAPEAGPPVVVDVPPYDGAEPAVRRMAEELAEIRDDLAGAFVHGSLGTGEVIPYSDFDALVVLKDDVFASPERLARAAFGLYRSRAVMLDFDPLQHHGWFVLAEAQLAAYPEHYLPRVLFEHAKAILPGEGRRLVVRPLVDRDRQRDAFLRMVGQIVRRPVVPRDLYEAKVMLSQFMLLPALYLQARTGEGVFKRDSFEAARPDFDARDWAVMDEVSAIRSGWDYSLSGVRRRLFTSPSPVAHRLAKRYAPPLPVALARVLTTEFHGRMRRLALLMAQRVQGVGERGRGGKGERGKGPLLISHTPISPHPHTPTRPCFVNRPRFVPIETYERAIERVVARMRPEEGAAAVYQLGGVSAPGISDVDLLVVFEEGARFEGDPLDGLSGDERYLFTHSLFGVSRSFFARAGRFTHYHGWRLRRGEALQPVEEAPPVLPEALVRQVTLEYLVMNYVSRSVERAYGVVSLRNLLLSVHAIRYDLAALGLASGALHDHVHELIGWRRTWFEEPVGEARLAVWLEGFHAALEELLRAELARGAVYLPPWARLRYSRCVRFEPAERLGWTHRGVVLPAWGGRLFGKKYIKLQHRTNRFVLHLPCVRQTPHRMLEERFAFLRAMKAYNAEHLPAFIPLSGSGNMGINLV